MSESGKMRRRPPRFSLRMLLILVTLTCVYFAVWEATKKSGVTAVGRPGRGRHFAAAAAGGIHDDGFESGPRL